MKNSKESPTSAQKRLAEVLAHQRRIRLPRGYSAKKEVCSEFISEHINFLRPTNEQLNYARAIAVRLGLDIHLSFFLEYKFCKKFLDLFAGESDTDEWVGFWRVQVIEKYMHEDKELDYLQYKLDMNAEDVAFMRKVIVDFKHDGKFVRADDKNSDDSYHEENLMS